MGGDTLKPKEIALMVIMTIFMNWFVIKLLVISETVIPKTEMMWIIGFFTGVIATKLLIETFNFYSER